MLYLFVIGRILMKADISGIIDPH